jgi:hypothetical protein
VRLLKVMSRCLTATGPIALACGWSLAIFAWMAPAAAAEPDRVAFDFAGFRQIIPAADDATLLAAKPAPRPQEDEQGSFKASYFDGVIRVSGHAIVAQYYDRSRGFGDRAWSYFDGGATVFPHHSVLAGRASGFLWRGYGNGVVDIAPDTTERRSYREGVRSMWQIYRFSTDPGKAFSDYAVRGRAGEVQQSIDTSPAGTAIRRFAFRLEHADRPHLKLWVFYPDDDTRSRPSEWVYAVVDLRAGRTSLARIRTRFHSDPEFEFPTRPADIVRAHSSVRDIDQLNFRDHTSFGPWKREQPRCGKPEE